MRRIAPGEHLARQQQAIAMLPAGDFLRAQIVEVDPLGRGIGLPVDIGPGVEVGLFEIGRPRAVEREMRMARGGAIGNHAHRLARRMTGPVEDLDVEHR